MKPNRIRQPNLLCVLIVCSLAVGVLFLGYEVVERTWLVGADPGAIHALHILRGVSAAVIASLFATMVLLRQTRAPAADAVAASSKGSLKHRLQNVRLRTKIVIPMVALAVLPTVTVGIFTISRMRQALLENTTRRVEFDTAASAGAIQSFLESVQEDLLFLSRSQEVRDLAAAQTTGPERIDSLRRRVEREFLTFGQGRRAYYQIRYLNGSGHEVVRLNMDKGTPAAVPPGELQDKSDRYYVQAGLALEAGRIYVSPKW